MTLPVRGASEAEEGAPDGWIARSLRWIGARLLAAGGGGAGERSALVAPGGPGAGEHGEADEPDFDVLDSSLAAAEARATFLARMSHEIRTPLNGVLGLNQILLETELTPQQRELSERIGQSGEQLLAILNDVLDYSRLDARAVRVSAVALDVREVVEDTLELFGARALEEGLDLAGLVDDSVPPLLVGDPMRLRQVLGNLVGNALKFTQEGCTLVRASWERQRLRLTVEDSGPGIPLEEQTELFMAFTQADDSSTRRHGGAGLGLAICARLVELMGGSIQVRSEVGRGSTFTVELPAPVSEESSPTAGLGPLFKGAQVLVAEPSPATREALCQLVREGGGEATAVPSVREACAVLMGDLSPDLLFLSMRLEGEDALRMVVAQAEGGTVLVGSSLDGSAAGLAARLGVDGRLPTPVQRRGLTEVVGRVRKRLAARSEPPAVLEDLGVRREDLRILVAEDTPLNQEVILLLLERVGYSADLVETGVEAVEAVARTPYDVVLMDIAMPDLDGLQATEQIRAAGGHQPVVLVTSASVSSEIRGKARAAGVDGFVDKPIRARELARALALVAASQAARTGVTGPRPEATEPHHTEAVVSAPPVDRAGALERLGIEPETYEQLLARLRPRARETVGELRGALEAGEVDLARRLAHSLKGSAATVGADALAAVARRLELGPPAGEVEATLRELEAEVSRLPGGGDEVQQTPLPELSASTVIALRHPLESLRDRAERGDVLGARTALTEAMAWGLARRFPEEYKAVRGALDGFELDAAARAAAHLCELLAEQESELPA